MNEIERLIGEAADQDETQVDAVEPPSQSFRIVGGRESAQMEVPRSVESSVQAVAVTAIRADRFLAVPIQDAPAEGYSINENGYDVQKTRAKVVGFLGPDAYIDARVWVRAQGILEAGGKVIFVRSATTIEVQGRSMFPVRIQE